MGLLPGIGASLGYQVVRTRGDALQTAFAGQKTVEREIAHFRDVAARAKSADDILKDYRALKFLLTSFQMESEIDKRAILRKLLTEDPQDSKSLANRFVDPRYRQLAQAVAAWDPPALADAKTVDRIVQGYIANAFEKSAGEDNPGLREALYFRRQIGSIRSVTELMSDKALTYVVRVGLGLPESFGLLDFEQQRRILEQRLDLHQFATAAGIEAFTRRFLAMNDMNSGGSAASDPRLVLLNGGGGVSGLFDVLGQTVNLRI